jgi:hypothetical protein
VIPAAVAGVSPPSAPRFRHRLYHADTAVVQSRANWTTVGALRDSYGLLRGSNVHRRLAFVRVVSRPNQLLCFASVARTECFDNFGGRIVRQESHRPIEQTNICT